MSKLPKQLKTSLTNTSFSIYIHIPFCTTLCPFCDFYKKKWTHDLEKKFISAISQEIAYYSFIKKKSIKSIFIGGGTPSILSEDSLNTIFTQLHKYFQIKKETEITIETNPEDISDEKLNLFKKIGINRISLGIQTLNKNDCITLGRGHTTKQSIEALTLIRQHSDWNLNADLMFGIPNSTLSNLEHTIVELLKFSPNHISTYCLTIEKNTVFEKQNVQNIPADKELEQYKLIQAILQKNNFKQYEVSSFAQPSYQCNHNKQYWAFKNFIGLGPSAHSFIAPFRFTNTTNLNKYCASPKPLIYNDSIQPIPKDTLINEHIIANLRHISGIRINTFNKKYNLDFEEKYSTVLNKLTSLNYISKTKSHIKVSKQGRYVLDSIMSEFL